MTEIEKRFKWGRYGGVGEEDRWEEAAERLPSKPDKRRQRDSEETDERRVSEQRQHPRRRDRDRRQ